jgi:hypothetical protein
MFEKRKLASAITLALALPTTMSVEVAHAAASFTTGSVETADVSTEPAYCNSVAVGTAGAQGVINTGATYITYATELFGSGSVVLPTATAPEKWPAVIYTTDGDISKSFNMTFSLSNGASFADTVLCADNDALNGTSPNTGSITTTSAAGETVTYKIQINTNDTSGDTVFDTGSKLVLAYKLTNTQALATADEDIEMTADLRTITVPPTPVNPALTTTVAKSATAISAKITPQASGTVKISVASESKEFTGTAESYQNSTTAEIGLLEVKQAAEIKREDGINNFEIGSGKIELDGTTLVIENGQFDASKASPGKVFLANTGDDTLIGEAAETVDEDGTATFELSSDEVASIISVTGGGNDVGIRFQVDGKTPINSVENPPPATFTLAYDEATIAGLEVGPVDLRKIFQDGTKCTVYNVPNTAAQDDLSILITNDSVLSAELTLTLDDQDGNELFKGPIGPLEAWKTMRVSSEDLERLMQGVAIDPPAPITWDQPLWTKRGVLYISTTIPKIEILALLRDKASNINSNLSTGASGVACEN